ncbi:MAG: hypothetical protein K2Q20_00355, partial [Phycisphaerales bacterium]|nr:hypothetical protein [Phycisphaerales bacterium]
LVGPAADEFARRQQEALALGLTDAGLYSLSTGLHWVGEPPMQTTLVHTFVEAESGVALDLVTLYDEQFPWTPKPVVARTIDVLSDGTMCGIATPPLPSFPSFSDPNLRQRLPEGAALADLLALHRAMLARSRPRSRPAGVAVTDWSGRLGDVEEAWFLGALNRGWLRQAETPGVLKFAPSLWLPVALRQLAALQPLMRRIAAKRARRAQLEHGLTKR